MEALLVVVGLLAGGAPLVRRTRADAVPQQVVLLLAVIGSLAVGVAWHAGVSDRVDARRRLLSAVPASDNDGGYVSSAACRACHPREYHTWHRSFHRTMTQLADATSVDGRFDGTRLLSTGTTFTLTRDAEAFWVEIAPPAGLPTRARIVMTTGSHHMQFYWYESGLERTVHPLPFGYLLADQRWVPMKDTFLRPPDRPMPPLVWNTSCIKCHAVSGRPRYDFRSGRARSEVAELGIACEACHGPGAAHVSANRDPTRRYDRGASEPDPTIVHPGRLDARASSQVCGQCHSLTFPRSNVAYNHDGLGFRPGDSLEDAALVMRHPDRADLAFMREVAATEPEFLGERYWPDGMVRVSGRDYSAMIESPCYRRGDLSCLSCHSMHDSDPDDQLAPLMETDRACLQCHGAYAGDLEAHTHHAPESNGSRCYNCHMPHTTYGLLKAIRSHEIANPSVDESVRFGRPNACNLCHLDQPLEWTALHLRDWYGQEAPGLDLDERTIAASLLWLLRGDAGQRALAAWHFGWTPARQASGDGWMAPHLAALLEDPYAAVRYITARSLRTLPGYEGFAYDFTTLPAELADARTRALAIWARQERTPADRGHALLLDAEGRPDEDAVGRLRAERDDRPVYLAE